MCGIIGAINGNKELIEEGLQIMKNRGNDGFSIKECDNFIIGHNLHSIVGYVVQPIENENFIFATNCEIYNWEELKKEFKLSSKNDAELMFDLLISKGIESLNYLDGVYSFALYDKKKKKVILGRDIIGVKPLFYYFNKNLFAFSSEKKSLLSLGIPRELSPRQILEFDVNLKFKDKKFFEIYPENEESYEKIKKDTLDLLEKAILKRVPKTKFGILFSGGIDSTIIAYILKKNNIDFTLYTSAVSGFNNDAEDLIYSKKIAEKYNFNLKISEVSLKEIENTLPLVCSLIESNNVVKVGVALPFFFSSALAEKDGCKVLLSGLGSEEIFAGYERHANSAGIGIKGHDKLDYEEYSLKNVNKECLSGLLQIHERDLYRDDVVTMYNKTELRLPFLDKSLVDFALKIPAKYKISKTQKKIILREISREIGLEQEFAERPKKAAQYGSKFDKALDKLRKENNYKTKSEYLKQFYTQPNLKLASLLSTGKDSLYATYVMKKQNYEISCFCTMESENEDSYMFHTPTILLAKYQSEASEIPLLTQKTKGNKEQELNDLKLLLSKAKKEFNVDGVVTGAIYSTYQRDRIEKICDELGLICKNPLWHKNQEDYMYELIKEKFKFYFSKVMADGLDESWVGKEIKKEDVDKLVELNKKIGINIAGEGGEFETLVFDCPLFKKKLNLCFVKKYDAERNETVSMEIEKVNLV